MPDEQETFRGKQIVLDEDQSPPRLLVEGVVVAVEKDETTGNYATSFLPYSSYGSLKALAHDLVENSPDFRPE